VIKHTILRWAGYSARKEEGRVVFRVLKDKPTGNIALGRHKCR
jgi:hypothetical protein